MDYSSTFLASMQSIPQGFNPDELAYLSLTSKPEHRLRDAVAFNLYKQKIPDSYVCREWKRVDLVIINAWKPMLLVEFKCAYSFDFLSGNPNIETYGDGVLRDIYKMKLLGKENTAIYAVLFLVHPLMPVHAQDIQGVKYSRGVKYAFESYHDASTIEIEAEKSVTEFFQKHNCTLMKSIINAGVAFDIPVHILTWVIKSS